MCAWIAVSCRSQPSKDSIDSAREEVERESCRRRALATCMLFPAANLSCTCSLLRSSCASFQSLLLSRVRDTQSLDLRQHDGMSWDEMVDRLSKGSSGTPAPTSLSPASFAVRPGVRGICFSLSRPSSSSSPLFASLQTLVRHLRHATGVAIRMQGKE